ncbi:MAG TPA: glutaminyl-peptide cyclotransferase [Roseiflexaceae bacterium]|nr:glutaminyl-peptide cyclotransferase [Roseiflexaceae bacterium]
MTSRLSVRLCFVLALLLLSACGGAAQQPTTLSIPATAQPQPSPPATAIATSAPSTAATAAPTSAAAATLAALPTLAPAPTLAPQPLPASPAPAPSATRAPQAIGGSCIPAGAALPTPPDAPANLGPADPNRKAPAAPPVSGYEVVNVYPHDPRAWTEGLLIVDGWLYEGTGRENGLAKLSRLELETGAVLQRCELPADFYGEGVTIFGDAIYQLTWQSHVGFVYDRASFAFRRAWSYPTEGWGLTHDGTRLIMSDGTSAIYFLDPQTLEEIGRIDAYDQNGPVIRLNELEYINGEIYANVWLTDRIARIDPQTGQVLGWIDLTGLLGPEDRQQPVAELNGIAYDAERDRLFVTGKLWPKLFEIKLKL